MGDTLFALICLANATGVDLEKASGSRLGDLLRSEKYRRAGLGPVDPLDATGNEVGYAPGGIDYTAHDVTL